MAVILACALMLSVIGCAAKHKGPGNALAPADFVNVEGRVLQGAALAAALERADYVLVGETHDNPVDHKAQAALVEALARAGHAPAIGLEMLPRKRHDATLRRFSRGKIELDALAQALDWQNAWGFDFALYRPVFEVAARYGLPLYGLNIDNDLRRTVSRKGLYGLNRQETNALPLAVIFPLPAQEKELEAFFSSHSAMIRQAGSKAGPDKAGAPNADRETKDAGARARLKRFVLVQSIWDSVMAEQAVRLRHATGGPMVILAGSGHVENGYGIARRLRIWDPAATVLTVMPFYGDAPRTGADLFYYSPERKRIGLRFADDNGEPRITMVLAGSAAEKAGLKAGDRVLDVNGAKTRSAADLHRAAVNALSQGTTLSFTVRRDNGEEERLSVLP